MSRSIYGKFMRALSVALAIILTVSSMNLGVLSVFSESLQDRISLKISDDKVKFCFDSGAFDSSGVQLTDETVAECFNWECEYDESIIKSVYAVSDNTVEISLNVVDAESVDYYAGVAYIKLDVTVFDVYSSNSIIYDNYNYTFYAKSSENGDLVLMDEDEYAKMNSHYKITYNDVENGGISVTYNDSSAKVYFTPKEHYTVKKAVFDGQDITNKLEKVNGAFEYTVDNLLEDKTVSAEFEKIAITEITDIKTQDSLVPGSEVVFKADFLPNDAFNDVTYSAKYGSIDNVIVDGKIMISSDAQNNQKISVTAKSGNISKTKIFFVSKTATQDDIQIIGEKHAETGIYKGPVIIKAKNDEFFVKYNGEIGEDLEIFETVDNLKVQLCNEDGDNLSDYFNLGKIEIDSEAPVITVKKGEETISSDMFFSKSPDFSVIVTDNHDGNNVYNPDELKVSLTMKKEEVGGITSIYNGCKFKLENQGEYILTVTYTDQVGNKASVTKKIVFDDSPPKIEILSENMIPHDNGKLYSEQNSVTIVIEDDNVDLSKLKVVDNNKKISVDLSKIENVRRGTQETTIVINGLADGEHSFNVYCEDLCAQSGNAVLDFVVDTSKPKIDISIKNKQENESCFKDAITVVVSIDDNNISSENVELQIKSAISDEYDYNPGITWCRDDGKLIGEFDLSAEDSYKVSVVAKDYVGLESAAEKNFIIDLNLPTVDSIEISSIVTPVPALNKVFMKNFSTLKTTVSDELSGVKEIKYVYMNENGDPIVQEEKTNNTLCTTSITQNFTVGLIEAVGIKIGSIEVTVTDQAGNIGSNFYNYDSYSNTLVVVDDVAPVIEIEKSNNSSKSVNGVNYYRADQTFDFSFEEDNFNPETTFITITQPAPSNTVTINYNDLLSKSVSSDERTHYGSYKFDEDGEYAVSVQCIDYSGNVAAKDIEKFVIDKTAPIINISFDNNSAANDKYFNKARVATLTVEEAYFDSSNVIFSGEGYSKPTSDMWNVVDGLPTLKISFDEEANYTFGTSYTDRAGNPCEINIGNSVAPYEFTVDVTNPTAYITIGGMTSSNGKDWNSFFENIRFAFFSNDKLSSSVKANDNLSGVHSVEYLICDSEKSQSYLKSTNDWIYSTIKEVSFDIDIPSQAIVYARVTDMANNLIYLNSDGVIIEKTAPVIEKCDPSITIDPKQPVNDIYNQNVKVNVNIEDVAETGDVYSGIKSVSYRVYSDNQLTQSGSLFEFAIQNPMKTELIREFNSSIIIDSKLNDSNNVAVEVIAIDNCGNSRVKTTYVKIDVTIPKISVEYDNNTSDSKNTDIYKDARKATIQITERNFSAADVTLIVRNTHGTVPAISSWSSSGDVHTAQVVFSDDGDYTFDIECIDLAGNKAVGINYINSKNPTKFTIDRTAPAMAVEYDNNSHKNANYYKSARTATIIVTEHNFDSSRINISMQATLDGKPINTPEVSKWTSNGDVNTAKIKFVDDAKYSISISADDMAGNKTARNFTDEFYVDQTQPLLKIDGVNNCSANNAELIGFTITATDVNFEKAIVTLEYVGVTENGYETKTVDITDIADIKNGKQFTVENLEDDGMYSLRCIISDKAGNVSREALINNQKQEFSSEASMMQFTVNRLGSTFQFTDETYSMMNQYLKSSLDVEVIETNPDPINPEDTKVVVYKNNEAIELDNDKYTREQINSDGEWCQYLYTISDDFFDKDGFYRISISSIDKAKNVSESVSTGAELSFAIDNTKPICNVMDLKDSEIYNTPTKEVKFDSTDNIKLSNVTVYLNDEVEKEYSAEQIGEIVKQNKGYDFDIEAAKSKYTVEIVYRDAAGNEDSKKFEDIIVTTSKWVLFYTNTPLFVGSIILLIILIAAIVFIIVRKIRR